MKLLFSVSDKQSVILTTVIPLCLHWCVFCSCRCFGLLVSPGRNVKHGDMTLIEKVSV